MSARSGPDRTDPDIRLPYGLFGLTVKRPVAILMVVIAVVVFGLVSYNRLSLNLMPDITYPSLTIRTEYPGTAPEEVENLVSRPIEEAVGVVNNLVGISSISKSEISDVILEFTWDTDMNIATQDVREKLDPIYFPDGVEKPIILRYDPSLDPVIRFGVYGTDDLYTLRKICEEDIKRELEGIPGVAAVKVKGGLEEEIRVEVDEGQLAAFGLDIGEVNRRLAQENINLAGGKLKEGDAEYLVRTFNEFRDIDEIGDVVIGEKNGVSVRVKDIGRVLRGHPDREVITRVNGRESVEIEIHKEADANAVDVARRVNAAVYGTERQRAYVARMEEGGAEEPGATGRERGEEGKDKSKKDGNGTGRDEVKKIKQKKAYEAALKSEMTDFLSYRLPEGIDIITLSDQSIFIENSVNEVKDTAVLGGLLAVIVLYLFLRSLASTLIVGVSIPVSIVATFACMHVAGVSLNIMSLGGLALGVGMLVDNSIVVIESIFRCREEGDGLIEAALRGVREVSGAVIASTLTTIAVFFPIVFVEGVAGQVFGDMSMTVVFALLTSLLVSIFVIPMLASRRLGEVGGGRWRKTIDGSNFLQFETLQTVRPGGEEQSNAGSEGTNARPPRLWTILARALAFARELLSKTILFTWTALEVVIKSAAGAFYPVIPAVAALVRLVVIWRPSGTGWDRAATAWFGRDRGVLLPRGGLEATVWAGIFRHEAQPALREGVGGLGRWASRVVAGSGRPPLTRVLMAAPVAVGTLCGLLYLLTRFYFHLALAVAGKVLTLLLLIVILLVTVVVALIGSVLAPPVSVLVGLFDRGYRWMSDLYPVVLRRAVMNPSAVVAAAGIPLLICIFVLLPRVGRELIPEVHQGEFNIEVAMPVGTPIWKTQRAVEPIEEMVLAGDGVEDIATVVGAEKKSNPSAEEGEHTAKLTVRLAEEGDLAEKEEGIIHDLRGRLALIPDMEVKISRPTIFSYKTPVEVEIRGYDLGSLERISRDVALRMARVDGLSDVRTNIQRGYPEVRIRYDREQLARYGLGVREVASLVRNKVLGEVATEYREEDRKIDVRVRLRETDKESIDDLRRLVVNPGSPVPIPLSAVADIRVQEGPSEIRRIDQQRAALITANLEGVDLGRATRAIHEIFDGISMPADFSYDISGQNREMETSMRSLIFAMTLAIFLVYVVMASQFESLVHPLVIIFTVPLALIGVILTLYLAGIPISVMVLIGFIMLVGIVVNNAIVLIDYINTLRRRGIGKVDAIVQAGRVRMRPILMTTATTVLGLLPMALGLGEGAEIRTPMAVTVIAGLISATLLTLIVIPTIYRLVARGE